MGAPIPKAPWSATIDNRRRRHQAPDREMLRPGAAPLQSSSVPVGPGPPTATPLLRLALTECKPPAAARPPASPFGALSRGAPHRSTPSHRCRRFGARSRQCPRGREPATSTFHDDVRRWHTFSAICCSIPMTSTCGAESSSAIPSGLKANVAVSVGMSSRGVPGRLGSPRSVGRRYTPSPALSKRGRLATDVAFRVQTRNGQSPRSSLAVR